VIRRRRHVRPRYVGYYLSAAAALTIVGLRANRETKDEDFAAAVETALVP
jgi:hypothetical protein